jgi:hypothetical protein
MKIAEQTMQRRKFRVPILTGLLHLFDGTLQTGSRIKKRLSIFDGRNKIKNTDPPGIKHTNQL